MANCCCCPERPIITDEVCGNFSSPAAATLDVYNTIGNVSPFGSVTVLYQSGTDPTITFSINGGAPITVPLGTAVTATAASITDIDITGTAAFSGKYCLNLHYQV